MLTNAFTIACIASILYYVMNTYSYPITVSTCICDSVMFTYVTSLTFLTVWFSLAMRTDTLTTAILAIVFRSIMLTLLRHFVLVV